MRSGQVIQATFINVKTLTINWNMQWKLSSLRNTLPPVCKCSTIKYKFWRSSTILTSFALKMYIRQLRIAILLHSTVLMEICFSIWLTTVNYAKKRPFQSLTKLFRQLNTCLKWELSIEILSLLISLEIQKHGSLEILAFQ